MAPEVAIELKKITSFLGLVVTFFFYMWPAPLDRKHQIITPGYDIWS